MLVTMHEQMIVVLVILTKPIRIGMVVVTNRLMWMMVLISRRMESRSGVLLVLKMERVVNYLIGRHDRQR